MLPFVIATVCSKVPLSVSEDVGRGKCTAGAGTTTWSSDNTSTSDSPALAAFITLQEVKTFEPERETERKQEIKEGQRVERECEVVNEVSGDWYVH